jgi:5-methylcytosine-specific restriction endonuclease McrA
MKIISKREAVAAGQNFYFTGKVCKREHLSVRSIDGECVECRKLRQCEGYHKNPHAKRKRTSAWRLANPERARAYKKRSDLLRGGRMKSAAQVCRCCSAKDFEFVYSLARPGTDEVDHIKPLALGGMHCTKNMQILTVEEHRKKTRQDIAQIAAVKRAERWLAI